MMCIDWQIFICNHCTKFEVGGGGGGGGGGKRSLVIVAQVVGDQHTDQPICAKDISTASMC